MDLFELRRTPARAARHRARALVAAGALIAAATPLSAQDAGRAASRLDAWRARLVHDSAGVWIASNEPWQEEDGGTERYGLDWSVSPGAGAGTGCLWGERNGEVTVHWRFHRLWDPVQERGLVYQISPPGGIALGWIDPLAPDHELIQTLVRADGLRQEIRHLQESDGEDVHLDRSFQRGGPGEAWQPGRSYRWERRSDVVSPCGDPDRDRS